ncbi:pentapeptide repeat-containing protein [Nostoc sp. CALU 1950]|uniref:pentapeptide repeat-containing protein n=1 Tax=Nostoc sp. CALU 1950 TaxID=3104321 RepID=UPI003EBE19CC
MNAEELLEEYTRGERNFTRVSIINQSLQEVRLKNITFRNCDLRGTSFAGSDLRSANFLDNTKINGTNFHDTDLTGANFQGAKTGFYYNWQFLIIALILFVCGLSGFTSAILITFLRYYLTRRNTSLLLVIIIATFFISTIRTIIINFQQYFLLDLNIVLSIAAIVVVACTGIVATSVNESEAIKSVSWILVFIGLVILIFFYATSQLAFIEKQISTLPLLTKTFTSINKFGDGSYLKGIITGLIGAIVGAIYSKKAIKGDKEFVWMWRFFIQILIEHCGTIFTKSQLRNADFTGINLKGSCFKNAKFGNTKFQGVTFLERADFRGTCLQKKSIQNLAKRGDGCRQNFTGENLTGINLNGASLEEAILIGTNLIDCSLEEAKLSFANLKQAQLQGAILSNATLTGAYIENWLIDRNTKLDNVNCLYISLSEEPNQMIKPENQYNFSQEDEFVNYVRPQLETINIFLKSERNYWAVTESLFQLAEKYPKEQLQFPIIEPVINGSLLIRIPVVGNVNKSRLRREFIELYNKLKNSTQQLRHQYHSLDIFEEYLRIIGSTNINIYNTNQQGENPTMNSNKINISAKNNQVGDSNQIIDTSGNGNNQVFSGENGTNNVANMINNSSQVDSKELDELKNIVKEILDRVPQNTPNSELIPAEEIVSQELKGNPTLTTRLQAALKGGGTEALKAIFNHPIYTIPIETIKGWLEAE